MWNGAPRERVHDTYRHIFRRTEAMTRQWVTAIADGHQVDPDFATGARVQELVAAAITQRVDRRFLAIGSRDLSPTAR